MASRFAEVPEAPPVEIFALAKACKEDPDPRKVDLAIGGKLQTTFELVVINVASVSH